MRTEGRNWEEPQPRVSLRLKQRYRNYSSQRAPRRPCTMHRKLILPAPQPLIGWQPASLSSDWLRLQQERLLCVWRGVQDGGGWGGGALPEQHEQEQGPLRAAHLCDQVGAAWPRSAAPRPALRTTLGCMWVLWCCGGPAELGVVAGPRQLLGGLRAGVGLFPLCPYESPPAVLYSAQDSPRVRVGAVERDIKEAMKVLGGWSTSSMNKCWERWGCSVWGKESSGET